MHQSPDQPILAVALLLAVAKRLPVTAYTIVFLVVGLAFAVSLVVMAGFYGRKKERAPDSEPAPSPLEDRSTRPGPR
jgi:uncharacterized ion transporter superfamily protein YfcC